MISSLRLIFLILLACECSVWGALPSSGTLPPPSDPRANPPPFPQSRLRGNPPPLPQSRQRAIPPAPSPMLEAPALPTRNEAQEILELIENQLSAIQSKDFNRAYFIYTAEPFREVTSLAEFTYFVEHYSVFTHNKNALFGNPEFRKKGAILRGSLTATDGQSFKTEYYLLREGDQWKINGIKLIPHSGF